MTASFLPPKGNTNANTNGNANAKGKSKAPAISFRCAKATDLPAIQAIMEAAYTPYIAVMGQKPAPMLADYAAHLNQDTVFVTERISDQTASLLAYAIIIKKPSGYWLENIAVSPAASGQGLGSALIRHLEDYLRQATDHYQLYTNIRMTAHMAWYERLGFVETRREREDGYERVFYKKILTTPTH